MCGEEILSYFVRWQGSWTVGQTRRKPGKIQFFTKRRRNGFTGWKLDGAVIGSNDDRFFEADGFRNIMRAFRAKSAAYDCQVTKF